MTTGGDVEAEAVGKESEINPTGPYAEKCACGVYREPFGTLKDPDTGKIVEATVFTLTCHRRFAVRITDYGATVVAIRTPDRNGLVKDLVFGFDDVQGYVRHRDQLLGGMVGRVAGRIPYARFVLRNTIYNLTENVVTDGPIRHHQDGGFYGLQNVVWSAHVPGEGGSLVLSVVHPHEEDGFPGAVLVQLRYQVTVDFRLMVHMKADTTAPTIIGLRQGIMFNLAGHDADQKDLMDHILTINADVYAATTKRGTPTGEKLDVKKTALDFRTPRRLRKQHWRAAAGYQHVLVLDSMPHNGPHMVARLEHPESGRVLEVRSNQPCVHVYTGGRLPLRRPPTPTPPPPGPEQEGKLHKPPPASYPERPSKATPSIKAEGDQEEHQEQQEEEVEEEEEDKDDVRGKDGVRYNRFCGIWLAPQWFPNAINMERFPKSVLVPGQTYEHLTMYRFYTVRRHARHILTEELVSAALNQAVEEVDTREPTPPPPRKSIRPPE